MYISNTCAVFCSVSCAKWAKIRYFPSTDAVNKFTVSLILSRLGDCNSLLVGIHYNRLNKLQRIQNRAARHALRKSRHASATALLRTLQWLPVKARIPYKIACHCFQCIYQNSMPPYTSDPSRTLPSLDTLLTVPRFLLENSGKNDLSLFLDPLSGTHYHYPSEKSTVFTNFTTKIQTHLFHIYMC